MNDESDRTEGSFTVITARRTREDGIEAETLGSEMLYLAGARKIARDALTYFGRTAAMVLDEQGFVRFTARRDESRALVTSEPDILAETEDEDEDEGPIPLRRGEVRYGPDGVMRWIVLDRDRVEANAEMHYADDPDRVQLAQGLAIDSGWIVQPFYHGPGRGYAHEPKVRLGRNRVLVTQQGGRDV